ncbi:hypothetical protein [Roseiconus lacunae]|uniref:hypothetical protein n=1 Tax=Roseiconus lacunae TaxID=2605694 RepID=UPI001E5A9C13|nr:hypothetical protein [Roseiconus lacunae]MCD0462503.1 hypothetical protein [Roseiconus lacunae]
MHKLTLYPLGSKKNADTTQIDLNNGKKLLFDFAAVANVGDVDEKGIDLSKTLSEDLDDNGKQGYDITAFTHLDDDHTRGADAFFYFEHSKSHQTKDRYHFGTLWVPANVITESRNDLTPSSKLIQAEARYRLENDGDVRVFSRPKKLKDWLESKSLTIDSRKHRITDAGQLAPELTLGQDGVEFFVHAPFAWRQDENTLIDRNGDSLVLQATFSFNSELTRFFIGSDVAHGALSEIVQISKGHKNEVRLLWDVMGLPHHCSYLTLGPDRGTDKTEPVEDVKWLFETQGQDGCIIVSSSKPIPAKGTNADKESQPPHRQAANYYREVADDKDGEFVVTMEHPKLSSPKPIVIEISGLGAKLKKTQLVGAAAVTASAAPRAGSRAG